MRLACLLISLLLIACERAESPSPATSVETAQHVLRNAYIYTVDPARSVASAMAIRDGRIVYVGTDRGAEALVGEGTKVTDLSGKMVLPGFIQQIPDVGISDSLDLSTYKTVEGYENSVRKFIQANPEKQLVVGSGWRHVIFAPHRPHKAILDQINDLIPIILFSEDGASVWTNSEGIAAAGIDMESNFSEGGRIEKDEDGLPIGIFHGREAVEVFSRLIPVNNEGEKPTRSFSEIKNIAAQRGVTTFFQAVMPLNDLNKYLSAFDRPLSSEKLSLRIRASFEIAMDVTGKKLRELQKVAEKYSDDDFKINSVSLKADKVGLGDQRDSGLSSELISKIITRANSHNFQFYLDAKSNKELAALQKLIQISLDGGRELGLRNTLLNISSDNAGSVLSADKEKPILLLSVAARSKVSPDDKSYLTESRKSNTEPRHIAVVMDSGYVAGREVSPIQNIHAGVSNQISLETMIEMFTFTGAVTNHLEQDTGSLEVGKWADFIVLDKNLFLIPQRDIGSVRVIQTYYKGQKVYDHRR
ncbi:amidohydrolase [Microbulbifer sp. EKSA005]|uniref:amidohydrolase n=1 Tax=Microbulbifer sp. EKSA005 TaxID=3243364 RepID=UPI00404160AA